MSRIYINELRRHIGEEVRLKGWLANKRSSGKINFLIIRDGTGFVQCVLAEQDDTLGAVEAFSRLTMESSVHITGRARKDDRAPGGAGLSVRLYECHDDLLQAALDVARRCPCADGCPGCVGPPGDAGAGAKVLTRRLLEAVLES